MASLTCDFVGVAKQARLERVVGWHVRTTGLQALPLARRNHMKTSTSSSVTRLAEIAATSSHGAAFQYSADLVVAPPMSNTVMAIHKGRRPKMYLALALLPPLLSGRVPESSVASRPIGGAIKVNSNAPTHERCFLCAMNAAIRGRHIHAAMQVGSIAIRHRNQAVPRSGVGSNELSGAIRQAPGRSIKAPDAIGQAHPAVFALLIARHAWWGKARVCKGANGDRDHARLAILHIEDSGAACGAKVKPRCATLIADAPVLIAQALNGHSLRGESCLGAEHTAGTLLTRQAMADRDSDGFSPSVNRKLSTTAGCQMVCHGA